MYRAFSYLCLILILLTACVTTQRGKPLVANVDRAHDAHLHLGLTYLERENRESARRHLEKALQLKPKSAAALSAMGKLYQVTGEDLLAEQTFKRALEKAPSFTQGRVDYGQFLYAGERYQEAYDVLAQASKDLSYENRALALSYMADAALKLDKKSQAKSLFIRALSLDKQLSRAMLPLAQMHFTQGEYTKAKEYLDRYAKIKGNNAVSLWLGIRIERIFGNKDKEASYILALKNLYPYSNEYLLFKQSLKSAETP